MVAHLAELGHAVTSTYFRDPPRPELPAGATIDVARLDVRDPAQVRALFESVRPDAVYHFAGQAYVIPSWERPVETFDVNLTGTLHLLEAVRRLRPRCAFAFAGSGTEYGEPREIPTPEEAPLLPTSPYASSKAAADLLCYQYF